MADKGKNVYNRDILGGSSPRILTKVLKKISDKEKLTDSDKHILQMVKAEEIEAGSCFRKKRGQNIYRRIRESSALFYGLDVINFIYGVCLNGGMTEVQKGRLVFPLSDKAIEEQLFEDRNLGGAKC